MLLRVQGKRCDVLDAKCGERACFRFGFDKGSYVPGRGYVTYHRDSRGRIIEKPVCMTRHLHGCPVNSVCDECRSASVDAPGSACKWRDCPGETVAPAATRTGQP